MATIQSITLARAEAIEAAVATKITNPAQTADIADGAVTSAKIADGTIVAGDIASNAVTTAKILDANVTTAKIADANVTTAKIADSAITSAKIADGTIATADIADSAITTAKIADGAITDADVNASANIAYTKLQKQPVSNLSDVSLSGLADKQVLTYEASTSLWKNKQATGGVTVGATAPSSPNPGDAWFDSNDGTMYVWYADGNSNQWVQVQANSALEGTILARLSSLEGQAIAYGTQSPNYLINGGFDIWQRGTSSTAAGYATADRWYGNAGAATTFSQETSDTPTGFRYAYKMTLGATTACYVEQAIETSNAIQLAGKTATISAYLKGSTSQSVALSLYYSTSTDVGPSGSWTLAGSSTVSVGTTWSRYSSTVQVPATAKSLKVSYVQQGSNPSGTVLYLAGAQFEIGSVATAFRRNAPSIQAELAACQRYFYRTNPDSTSFSYIGVRNGVGAGEFSFKLPVKMRAAPTMSTKTNGTVYSFGANASYTPTGWEYIFIGSDGMVARTLGITIGGTGGLIVTVDQAQWDASAEL